MVYNPFMDIAEGNPNFNHLYSDKYKVDTSNCVSVVAKIEKVDTGRVDKETFLVTGLDVAEKQINEVLQYFNATLHPGESMRRLVGLSDLVDYKSAYGFIDRDGKFYPCEFGEHGMLAEQIIKDKGWAAEYFKHLEHAPLSGIASDFLVAKGWGLRHNPNIWDSPYLHCERPSEAMKKTDEDIEFYFKYIKKR